MSTISASHLPPEMREALGRKLARAEVHQLARQLTAGSFSYAALRLAILSTCTLEFSRSFLVVEGARANFSVVPYFGPFGQLEQQIEDEAGSLYEFLPDVLILMFRPEDIAPDIVMRPHARNGQGLRKFFSELVDRIGRNVENFRSRSAKPILVANFADPFLPSLGPLEAHAIDSTTAAFADANIALRERLSTVSATTVWDLAGLVRHVGTSRWTDRRLWALARAPLAADHLETFATHLIRTVRATQIPPAKCIVLDLDNTLWGGAIGDDGLGGIQLGDDFPGNVFKDFQRRLLALSDRGVLLAIVSKNELSVAEEVFHRHPDMLIRWTDIAAARINWNPKSANIREVAAELNIGSDQMVLFDDNPVERAEVALNAPEVHVADVPANPLEFAECLAQLPWFDQVEISDEDRQRSLLYQQRRDRIDAEKSAVSIEDFLADLQMTAVVGELDETTIGRVAQLIGKTNQFNLTTRRYGLPELTEMMNDPEVIVAWIRAADRFGDQGLVGVAIVKCEDVVGYLDSFLMSCRVMNRRVEHALLSFASERARERGCRHLIGEYLPTEKNGVVSKLYAQFGFESLDKDGRHFRLDVGGSAVPWPDVLRRIAQE